MVKSRYLVEFPAQKQEPKWFQNLGRFKKNLLLSGVAKRSPKNWTGPCLSLNMVRKNKFIKWQTPARNAKSSFEGANPTPPSPMQRWRPPARTTIESKRTVGGPGSEGDKTVEPHLLVKVHSASAPLLNHCGPQCNVRLAAEINISIFEWQTRWRHPKTASETSCVKKAPSPDCSPNILN